MIATATGAVVRFTICAAKREGNVFKKVFLVSLDGEMVMGISLLNQVFRYASLG